MFAETLPIEGPAVTIRYTPTARGRGLLVIEQKRCVCRYHVVETACDFDGRAARMTKVGGDEGSDQEVESYDVFVGADGEQQCDCRGFARFGHCKHAAALESLVGNGWINQGGAAKFVPPVVPAPAAEIEADVCDAEPEAEAPKLVVVWCSNDEVCGGVGVMGYDVPGSRTRQLCEKCWAAEFGGDHEAEVLAEIKGLQEKLRVQEQRNFLHSPNEVAVDRLMARIRSLRNELSPAAIARLDRKPTALGYTERFAAASI